MATEAELDYRDDRDEALLQVRKVTRRVNNIVEAHIKAEHAKANAEGRRVEIDLSQEGIRRLVLKTTIDRLGGGQIAAIDH